MKTKSKTTTKLVVSMLILAISVALAGTSTYAWFTMSDTVSVSDFNVNITSGQDLLITWVGSTYDGEGGSVSKNQSQSATVGKNDLFASTLDGLEITNYLKDAFAYAPDATKPTETIAKTLTHGTPATDGKSITTDATKYAKVADSQTNYFKFRLFFRSTEGGSIYLAKDDTVDAATSKVTSTPTPSKDTTIALPKSMYEDAAYATKYGNALPTISNGQYIVNSSAANAMRVGFTNATEDVIKVWNPNKGAGFEANNATGNFALDFFNATKGTSLTGDATAAAKNDVNFFGSTVDGTPEGTPNDTVLCTLTAGTGADSAFYYGYIDVFLWFEGHDADAVNAAFNDKVMTQLLFKVK